MKFEIEKAIEKAKFTIEKKGIPNVKAQIVTTLDVSGSARGLFTSGQMQTAWQTVMGVAGVLDLNQEIDVYTFADSNSIYHIDPNATMQNFPGYVDKNILNNGRVPKWGGTSYAPVIEQALRDFGFYSTQEKKGLFGFGGSKSESLTANSTSKDPVICYFFTDGAPDDRRQTTSLFEQMETAGSNFYVLFVGVGSANFSFIEELGTRFDNVGFTSARDLEDFANNENLYDELIPEELTIWLSKAR